MAERPTMLSTADVGRRLGYSDDTIRRMCEAGTFPGAYRPGDRAHWRIPARDVTAWLEAMKAKLKRARG